MTRNAQAKVSDIFINRWSPRSFNPEYQISDEEIQSIFEAARWAPSCFNEQPWNFILSIKNSSSFEDFLEFLVPANKEWACNASALSVITARKKFKKNDNKNKHAEFDSGAAWMSLTLQANELGLHTHAMAGINYEKVYDYFNLDKNEHEVLCVVAIGKSTHDKELPTELADNESISDRRNLSDIIHYEKFEA